MQIFGSLLDGEVIGALRRLLAMGQHPQPALAEIAALGEQSTRLRFRTQRGPDGLAWKPSLRVLLQGGRTLTRDGHLGDSLSSGASDDYAEWGVNRIYAAIHQFGGGITAKAGGKLKFPLPGGGWAVVKSVRMPARPYLGVDDDDRADILDVIERHLNNASGGAVHAG